MQKTMLLIPVDYDRDYLKLHLHEPDSLVKNKLFRYELLIPNDRSLIKGPVPFLHNLLPDIWQKSKY